MNDNPLNDPLLQSLEARLAGIPPRLPAGQQQQLLYECAFAAGKAAGRRASSRVIQSWAVAASILALLCAGLAYRTVLDRQPALAHSSPAHGAAHIKPDRTAAHLPTDDADTRQLSVMTAPERAIDFNWPRPSASQTAAANTAIESEQPVLTSRSRISPDSI
ncbi:MAG: hypothetical protein JF612_02495 [Planctomycetia bacterium]|jgi:hypothetical protein|nr:hypothetical protein [Planctomycetia bacterium]